MLNTLSLMFRSYETLVSDAGRVTHAKQNHNNQKEYDQKTRQC